MASICQATLDNKGDLGIIFDTDVDRAAIVGPNGRPINKKCPYSPNIYNNIRRTPANYYSY